MMITNAVRKVPIETLDERLTVLPCLGDEALGIAGSAHAWA